MFKGLAGLKKVVKGGISAVAEHSSQLADSVVNDPSTSKENLKESIKKKVQGGVASVVEVGETVANADPSNAKQKAAKVAHDIKHHGAFAEELLGYSDPGKDLRKAVRKKEKAAKKARKAKKKRTGKKEDLFDPENIAKYKKEIEEKRAREEKEFLDKSATPSALASSESEEVAEDKENKESKGDSPTSPPTESRSPLRSRATTPKEEKEDWQLFKSLTAGVDEIIQKTKDELVEIKHESFFQPKPTAVELEEKQKKKKKKNKNERTEKKKAKWVDLNAPGFEEYDGEISVSGSSSETEEADEIDVDEDKLSEKESDDTDQKKQDEEKKKREDIGLVEIPDDEPIDPDEEIDLFNTDYTDAFTSGEVKLAVIPDDLTYEDSNEDDPFNTSFAEEIVKKTVKEKKKEESRLKFEGLSNVADVLSGKVEKVDKSLIEHAVKRKKRRANRINLIAENESEVTALEDIATIVTKDSSDSVDRNIVDKVLVVPENEGAVVGDVLSSSLSPSPAPPQTTAQQDKEKKGGLVDLSEFEEISGESEPLQLTSNVAILAGEFAKPVEEEVDEFDAAFDALAHESVTKTKLEELEREFADDDIFDTSSAEKVLKLASLVNKGEENDEEPLETFEDKDPFDTSAFEDIAGELEEELEFESLAKREPGEEPRKKSAGPSDLTVDPFGGRPQKTKKDPDPFGSEPSSDTSWTAFAPKPKRPPPPKPKRPPVPKPPTVSLDPSSRPETPSVVVKAPSTESIKSWNCSVAETLIKKSELEAKEAGALQEQEEDEYDPFDTTDFEDFGGGSKEEEEAKRKEKEDLEIEDPFDTSAVGDLAPGEAELKALGKEKKIDLLTDGDIEIETEPSILQPVTGVEVDPFDTDFAAKVLPNKGDPFDTSFVSGGPGKAEIKALEEEFIDKDDFDPRLADGSAIPSKTVVPGVAGRVRPKGGGQVSDLKVKIPIEEPIEAEEKEKEEEPEPLESDKEEEEDPFDTSIVDKIIPVRKAKQRKEISVEDEEFDPTQTFKATRQKIEEELDPFDTSIAKAVLREEEDEEESPQVVPEAPKLQKGGSISSDDSFDPRA